MAAMTYDEGLKILYTAMSNLRGYVENSYAILYLATAYRQGWFEDRNSIVHGVSSPITHPLHNLQMRLSNDDTLQAMGQKEPLSAICSSLTNEDFFFNNIYRCFEEIESNWWQSFWLPSFDDILAKNAAFTGKDAGAFLQPKEITQLITRLCKGRQFSSVYNPFAGTGSFCSLVAKGGSYFGQEINSRIRSLGVLRMLANGLAPDSLVEEDTCENWACGQSSFDLIVGFPPMGMRYHVTPKMGVKWTTPNISLSNYFLIKGSECLNPGGKLIAIMSADFLSKIGPDSSLRKRMVREGRIESVIQLPAGILYGTGVTTCIVVLSDKTKDNNEILFVSASSFVKKEGRMNVLQVDDLVQSIKTADPRNVALVQREVVMANDCRLIPHQYLAKSKDQEFSIPEGFEEIPLKNLVSVYQPVACQHSRVRIVRGKDLSSTDEIKPTTFEALSTESLQGKRYGRMERDAILILKIRHLKPTLFEYKEDLKVLLSPNVMALVPKEGVDSSYIVSELRKDYITAQIDNLATGAYIPSLRVNDILTIKVLMPIDRSLQHSAFLNAQRLEKEQQLKSLQFEEYIKRERGRIDAMMSIRRHRINPYISGLQSNVSMLLDELFANEKLTPSSELSPNYSVQDALENMEENLVQLKRLFDAFTVDTSVGTAESIDLLHFLRDYSYTSKMPDRHFIIDRSQLDTKLHYPLVVFNSGNLTEALDEIIHNAEKHFAPNTTGCCVMLVPRFDGKNVQLLICNNGEPVPADFDEERSFVAGYHKDENGTGQGLFRVRQICDEFGATIAWENEPENLMPTGLSITFKTSLD